MIIFAREIHQVFNKQIADELYPICRDILDKTNDDERYLFGKTTFWQQGIMKDNIQIIPVSCVMYLQSSYSDSRLSKEAKQSSLITSCCLLSDKEVTSFITEDTI